VAAAGVDLEEVSAGVRPRAGTSAPSEPVPPRPLGAWAFATVAVASFGGPLALAALNAPGLIRGASQSPGLATLTGVAVFALPLVIWLRYARDVSGAGGLYGFVEAAAGRPLARAQAAFWIVG
jgi:hypothetical protein